MSSEGARGRAVAVPEEMAGAKLLPNEQSLQRVSLESVSVHAIVRRVTHVQDGDAHEVTVELDYDGGACDEEIVGSTSDLLNGRDWQGDMP